MKEKELFVICKLCKQYKPFYWVRYNNKLCFDCNPTKLSSLSRIINQPFVSSCNPDMKKQIEEQVKSTEKQYNNRPEIKIAENIRHRIRKIITKDNKHYTPETMELLGCNKLEFKSHIENLFKIGMTWENYGNKENQWSIDHITPLAAFNLFDYEQLLKANHYTNLQPLWHIDNMKKGSKICN